MVKPENLVCEPTLNRSLTPKSENSTNICREDTIASTSEWQNTNICTCDGNCPKCNNSDQTRSHEPSSTLENIMNSLPNLKGSVQTELPLFENLPVFGAYFLATAKANVGFIGELSTQDTTDKIEFKTVSPDKYTVTLFKDLSDSFNIEVIENLQAVGEIGKGKLKAGLRVFHDSPRMHILDNADLITRSEMGIGPDIQVSGEKKKFSIMYYKIRSSMLWNPFEEENSTTYYAIQVDLNLTLTPGPQLITFVGTRVLPALQSVAASGLSAIESAAVTAAPALIPIGLFTAFVLGTFYGMEKNKEALADSNMRRWFAGAFARALTAALYFESEYVDRQNDADSIIQEFNNDYLNDAVAAGENMYKGAFDGYIAANTLINRTSSEDLKAFASYLYSHNISHKDPMIGYIIRIITTKNFVPKSVFELIT